MAYGFLFRLETPDGAPAVPPKLESAVPRRVGDRIHLGRRTVEVVAVRDDDADRPPVLVIADADRSTAGDAA
jgi:hypothetical protein